MYVKLWLVKYFQISLWIMCVDRNILVSWQIFLCLQFLPSSAMSNVSPPLIIWEHSAIGHSRQRGKPERTYCADFLSYINLTISASSVSTLSCPPRARTQGSCASLLTPERAWIQGAEVVITKGARTSDPSDLGLKNTAGFVACDRTVITD